MNSKGRLKTEKPFQTAFTYLYNNTHPETFAKFLFPQQLNPNTGFWLSVNR